MTGGEREIGWGGRGGGRWRGEKEEEGYIDERREERVV